MGAKKDIFGVEIGVGDLVAVGSKSNVKVARVYGFGNKGQPLTEVLAPAWMAGQKGFNGYEYVVLHNGDSIPFELGELYG